MRARIILSLFLLGVFLALPGCGKKGPPFVPQKSFGWSVQELKAEWADGYFQLRGGLPQPDKAEQMVAGCRVHYGEYPLDKAPCETCPIEFHGYHGFGSEVVSGGSFLCKVPGKKRGHVYYFMVQLVGPEGQLGPPSQQVRVELK